MVRLQAACCLTSRHASLIVDIQGVGDAVGIHVDACHCAGELHQAAGWETGTEKGLQEHSKVMLQWCRQNGCAHKPEKKALRGLCRG